MTAPIPVPLSVVALDLASAFAEVEVPPDLPALLAQLDQSGPRVHGYRIVERAAGRIVELLLPDGLGAVLVIPGVTAFELAVGIANGGVLEVAEPGPHTRYAELRHLRLGIRFEPSLLRPLDGSARAELSWTGDLRCYPDWRVVLVGDPELTLPPCEIAGTGIVVELTGVQVDLSTATSPAPITALGLGTDFRGIYARSGSLRLLPQARFGGLAGVGVDIRDLAVGTSGVTGTVGRFYALEQLNGALDPANPLTGELFDGAWQLGIGAIEVELRHNAVTRFLVDGLLRVPLLDTLFEVSFGMARVGAGYRTTTTLASAGAISVSIGHGTLDLAGFALDGVLDQDGFQVEGAAEGVELNLDPVRISAGQAGFALAHRPDLDELRVELRDVALGPLGTVDRAELVMRDTTVDGTTVRELAIEAAVPWQTLRPRLAVPEGFPVLPDGGEVVAGLSWREDSGARRLVLRFEAELYDVHSLWPFLPADWRPNIDRFRFGFEATYKDKAEFDGTATAGTIAGKIYADVDLRLPDLTGLPGADLITISTGDCDGLIRARLAVAVDDAGTPSLGFEVLNPFAVDVAIPGFPAPEPPLHVAITRIALDLAAGEQASGAFVLEGAFEVRPFVPPATAPFAAQLAALFRRVEIEPPVGSATLRLAFAAGAAELSMTAELTSGGVDFDVFGMIADLARGIAPPPDVAGNEIELDVDAGFDLRGVRFQLGSLAGGPDAVQVAFELLLRLHLAGSEAEVQFRLSDRELSIGVPQMAVELRTPTFPLDPNDLAGLTTDLAWTTRLDEIAAEIDELTASNIADGEVLKALLMRQFLLSAIYDVRRRLTGPDNADLYDGLVGFSVGSMAATSALLRVDTGLTLTITDAQFVIPFADPRGIRLEGTAELDGFTDDSPLAGLNGMSFSLGLSAEMIYMSLRSDNAVTLPTVGHYSGGSIHLSEVTIGYGYTKNSLTVVVNGELVLPRELVADLDTSAELGAGVRLPHHNRLGLKLDLIPVVLGPVDFVMPLLEFDIDLREPGSPPFVSTAPAQPYWDGLQVIIPGIFRDAVKRIAFSPFFGMLPIPNLRLDGDLMIGDESTGLTVIADDVLILGGLGLNVLPPITIPLLIDPTAPYFENLCINVRFAGFGINLNLQRPFPSLSPLALFETLGLISDPLMEIDPDGALANTVRVSLTDAVVTLPPEVVRLFPGAATVNGKPVGVTLNLGTVVTTLQQTWAAVDAVSQAITAAAQDVPRAIVELTRNPPELNPVALLATLPPELRKHRLSGSFAGFDATAVLLIIDASDLQGLVAELERRDQEPAPVVPTFALDATPDSTELAHFRPRIGPGRGSRGRTFNPDEPTESLFSGIEFRAFTAVDIEALFTPDSPTKAGVIVGAHVKVFAGQRYRFLGPIFEDGSFALISALDIRPLQLSIAGITVSLPLRLTGRLVLTGRAKRDGYHGSIDARGYCSWNVVPGILQLNIASPRKPALFRLRSNGTFALTGDLRMNLFGTVVVEGTVEVDETHCFVSGSLTYRSGKAPGQPGTPIIDLAVTTAGRIGPGPTFEIAGDGELTILGQRLTKVSAVVNEAGAAITAELHTGRWSAGGVPVDCQLDLALHGRIDLRKDAKASFAFEGTGSLNVFGARVVGRAAITAAGGNVATEVTGQLVWQRREWLGGRVRVDAKGVLVEGRTSFALDLTPSALGPGMKLANLFFRIDLQGRFTLNKQAGLAKFSIKGDALLGARLAKGGAKNREQIFPLAMHSFSQDGEAELELPLMHVDGFLLLPAFDLGDLKIPVPVLVPKDDALLRLKTKRVDDDHSDGKHRVRLRWDDRNILPFQIPLTDFVVPEFRVKEKLDLPLEWDVGTAHVTLPLSTRFDLALVWYQGGLAVRVTREQPQGNLRTQHWKLSTAFG